MAREVQEVEREEGSGPCSEGNIIERHPSFGMIGISRQSSNRGDSLFGSSIQHNNTITLAIRRGEREVGPYRESFGTARKGELIEIEMSQAQFAELITTPNVGFGVPCTIRRLGYELIPSAPHSSRREEINRDVTKRMVTFAERIKEWQAQAKAITAKPSIGVADRKALLDIFTYALQEITSNLPFLHKCMDEAVEKSVSEAKTEIDAFLTNGIHRLGLEALAAGQSIGPAPEARMLTSGIEGYQPAPSYGRANPPGDE